MNESKKAHQAGDLIVHEGAVWRLVARRAEKDDKVIVSGYDKTGDTNALFHHEYLVLEDASDEYHAHAGEIYRKEKRRLTTADAGTLILRRGALEPDTVRSVDTFCVYLDDRRYVSNNVHDFVVLAPIAKQSTEPSQEVAPVTEPLEGILEVWALGKAAQARDELASEAEIAAAAFDKAVEAMRALDFELAAELYERIAGHTKKMAHWHREEAKYREMAARARKDAAKKAA